MSKNLLEYYQESGRAGRGKDMVKADCLCFFSPKDVSDMLAFVYNDMYQFSKLYPEEHFDMSPFWSMVAYCLNTCSDSSARKRIMGALGDLHYTQLEIPNPYTVDLDSKVIAQRVYAIMEQANYGNPTVIDLAKR
jgi:superfamily II DNA helicase RecQ